MSFFNKYNDDKVKLTDAITGEVFEFEKEPEPEEQFSCPYLKMYYNLWRKTRLILQCSWLEFLDHEIDIIFAASDEVDQKMEEVNMALPKGGKKSNKPQMPILSELHMVLLLILSQMFGDSGKKK